MHASSSTSGYNVIANIVISCINYVAQLKDQSAEDARALIALTVDCISDDELRQTAFRVYLERVAILLTSGDMVTTMVTDQHIEYAIQMLWELHMRSSPCLNKNFADYVSRESHLIFTLKALYACLETYSKWANCLI